ncbi:MAG: peptidylprolyl isomerase [Candidatus Muiribacteriota bacterium]
MFFGNKNKMIKVIIWIVAIAFIGGGVGFGTTSYLMTCQQASEQEKLEQEALERESSRYEISDEDKDIVLAELGQDKITVERYFDYFRKLSPEVKGRYKSVEERQNILDYIIQRQIVENAAIENNLEVTEDDKIQVLLQQMGDQLSNIPDSQLKEMLDGDYFDADELEYAVLEDKIKKIKAEVPEELTEENLRQYYQKHKYRFVEDDKYNISHILISKESEKRKQKVLENMREGALERYYNNNRNNYIGKDALRLRGLFIDPDEFMEKVEVTQEEIKNFYEENINDFKTEEEVKASHILVETYEEALDIKEKINDGQDFGELAREYSEDPGSKDNHGELGWFKRGTMVPEFDQKVFNMKPGEISSPVESDFGYHIIYLEDYKEEEVKSFEQVKESVKDDLTNQKARNRAFVYAEEIAEEIFEGNSINDYMDKTHGSTTHVNGDLDWVTKGEQVDNMYLSQLEGEIFKNGKVFSEIEEEIFDLRLGQVSEVISSPAGFHIIRLMERRSAETIPFSEVEDEVREDYVKWQKNILARNYANKAYSDLREGKTFEEIAVEYSDGKTAEDGGELPDFPLGEIPESKEGLQDILSDEIAQFTYFFKNNQFQAGVAVFNEIENTILNLEPGNYSNVVESPIGYHIIKLNKVREGEIRPFSDVKEEIVQQIDIQITEEQIANYYEENIDDFAQPEQYNLSHIVVSDEETARQLYLQLLEENNFEELAEEYSEDYTSEEGGEIGFISRGNMPEKFDEVAFSLEKGEISEPVNTPFGWHIIRVNDIQKEQVVPLEEARAEIYETLIQPERDRLFSLWIEEEKNRLGVNMHRQNFDYLTEYN